VSIQGTPFIYCFQLSTDTMTQYSTFRRNERGTVLSRRIPVNSAQPPSPRTPPLLENARLRVFLPTITLPMCFEQMKVNHAHYKPLPCQKCKTEMPKGTSYTHTTQFTWNPKRKMVNHSLIAGGPRPDGGTEVQSRVRLVG